MHKLAAVQPLGEECTRQLTRNVKNQSTDRARVHGFTLHGTPTIQCFAFAAKRSRVLCISAINSLTICLGVIRKTKVKATRSVALSACGAFVAESHFHSFDLGPRASEILGTYTPGLQSQLLARDFRAPSHRHSG
jgi:hypothetical protein